MEYTLSHKNQRGFTLPELVVVIAVMTIFLGLISVNLLQNQRRSASSAIMETFISDMRAQQIKAMTGDIETGTASGEYGIYIGPTSYTLFKGSSYSALATDNFVIELDSQYNFPINTMSIVFSKLTGEVLNYSALQDTVQIEDESTGQVKTIEFNRYGVPISTN